MGGMPVGRILIVLGAVLIAAGVIWEFGGRYLRLGRLPGDIAVERENFRFYFPVVTCIILSVILSGLFSILSRWFGGR